MTALTNNHISVSIIIPFYNVEDFAEDCIKSVLSQFYRDFELILVDDGSTDATRAILEHFAQIDRRVKLVTQENSGLSEARNNGVLASSGEFISFVDGDDIVSPYYLESLISALNSQSQAMAVGGSLEIRAHTPKTNEWKIPDRTRIATSSEEITSIMSGQVPIVAWARLAPRRTYLDTPYRKGAIYEDLIAIVPHISSVATVVHIDEPIYAHRKRAGSITNQPYSLNNMRLRHCAYNNLFDEIIRIFPDKRMDVEYHRCIQTIWFYQQTLETKITAGELQHFQETLYADVKNSAPSLLNNIETPRLQQLRIRLFLLDPRIHGLLLNAYKLFIKNSFKSHYSI